MKIVVDTLGAPERSGGMRELAELIVRNWATCFPDDQLLVVGNEWVADAFAGLANVRVHTRRQGTLPRIAGQWIVSGLLARKWNADALISTSPVVSPCVPSRRRICTVPDWRHRRRPEEFGVAQRAYRRLWTWSIRTAGGALQISRKTDDETRRYVPGANRFLLELGRDHAKEWRRVPSLPAHKGHVITFGHHRNKRPDLVIEAMSHVDAEVRPSLVVLGARGELAEQLARRADAVGAEVQLPGFVETAEYQALLQTSRVVVLASSDEGFGLPVVEAEYFEIPVVATTDGGLGDIHGSAVILSDPTAEALGAAIQAALTGERSATPINRSWAAPVSELRSLVIELTRG